MTKRNDIAPYERPEARRWTRVADYLPDAEAHVANVQWARPGSRPRLRVAAEPDARSRRGLALPVAVVALAALLSAWASGLFGTRDARQAAAGAAATTSRGLVFGLCSEGGVTNCVASGDSFYLAGKTVRIAGIEAPQLYGAACPKEAELGRKSALKLQGLLNSGALEMTRAGQDLDRYGLLLRHVSVDGRSVATSLIDERLAREIGDSTRSWC